MVKLVIGMNKNRNAHTCEHLNLVIVPVQRIPTYNPCGRLQWLHTDLSSDGTVVGTTKIKNVTEHHTHFQF